jgi:multiple sugar transport system substrate-binding protein
LSKIPAYATGKAAVASFTKWLAVYYAHLGVRVNALAPGFFMTEQLRFLHTDQATGEPKERSKQIMAQTPFKRYGEPSELVGTVVWLLTEAPSFVTGTLIPVDGGFAVYSIEAPGGSGRRRSSPYSTAQRLRVAAHPVLLPFVGFCLHPAILGVVWRYPNLLPKGGRLMRRVTLVVMAFLLVGSLAFAGGGQEEQAQPEAQAMEGFNWKAYEGTDINVIVNKHPWVDIVQPKISEFEELTGIDVSLDVYPEDQFRTKRTVEMVSGTSVIDVFMMMPGNSLAQYHTNGWVEPLNRFFEDENLLWPEYEMDDFYASALGAGNRASATSQWIDFAHSFGADWLDADGNAAIGSPESIAATEFYGRLLREYGPRSAPSNSWYESILIFMQGEAAMVYDASVFRPNYEDPEQSQIHDKVGYAIIPEGPAGRVPHTSNWGLAIYSGSENKEASWLFIQWATSKAMALAGQLEGLPSARASAWSSEEFKSRDTSPEWTERSMRSYELASPIWNPPIINVGEARDAAGSMIVAAILGEDVEAAAAEAEAEMNSIIADEQP